MLGPPPCSERAPGLVTRCRAQGGCCCLGLLRLHSARVYFPGLLLPASPSSRLLPGGQKAPLGALPLAMGPAAPRPPPQTSILAQEQPQGYGMVETYRGPHKGPQGGAQLAGGCFRGEPPPFHGISQAGNSSKLMQPRRAAWAKRLIKCFWLAGGQRQSLFFLYSDKQSGEGRGRKEEWGGGGAHSQRGSLWMCHQLGEVGREGGTGACTHTRTYTQCAHAGGWGETKVGGGHTG